MASRIVCRILLASLMVASTGRADAAESARWQVLKTEDGWRLLSDDESFYIKGAVGRDRFDVLRACGGNAVRAPAKKATLDMAYREGLFVMANLPIRAQRNGMDWEDAQQVAEQRRKVVAVVEQLRDHPALMFWSVGNELDYIPGRRSHHPQLWERLNDLAIALKEMDADHPVLTVVGTGRFEQRVQGSGFRVQHFASERFANPPNRER